MRYLLDLSSTSPDFRNEERRVAVESVKQYFYGTLFFIEYCYKSSACVKYSVVSNEIFLHIFQFFPLTASSTNTIEINFCCI